MVGTLCLSGAVLLKAGANVNSAIANDADLVSFINQAEGFLSTAVREDLVTNYAGYDSIIKLILEEFTSNQAAIYAIKYDMWSYVTLEEAEDMVNILWARNQEILKVLIDQKGTGYVISST